MEYLPEYEGVFLADSYVLGFVAEGNSLRFPMELALTIDHPRYRAPNPGEAHCYRRGSLLIEEPEVIEWCAGKPALSRDVDDTFDLGSLELYRIGATVFRVETEWFDMTVDAKRVTIVVS